MTKKELVEAVAKQAGVNINETSNIIEALVATIKANVAVGKPIFIRGFGTFELKTKKARKARNIKTGEEILLSERKVPVFKVSKNFM